VEIPSDDKIRVMIKISQWWPSQSRKETILNCLLKRNRGFIYRIEVKKRINKISDLLEVGKLKQWKKLSVIENITAACLKTLWDWKVKNIVLKKVRYLSKYYNNYVITMLYKTFLCWSSWNKLYNNTIFKVIYLYNHLDKEKILKSFSLLVKFSPDFCCATFFIYRCKSSRWNGLNTR